MDVDIVPMDSKKKVTISWSGGKDAAFALYKILLSGGYEVVNLYTVINKETKRVGLHGVREELIDLQAAAVGFPLHKIYVDSASDNEAYEHAMHRFYHKCKHEGIDVIVFGDIFLEDLKQYREKLLSAFSIQALYPLWKIDTSLLIQDFMHTGFKSVVCSANTSFFPKEKLGAVIDANFLDQLPADVDPCGENGEFHTLVIDGPLFKAPLAFDRGEVVGKFYHYKRKNPDGSIDALHESFWFQDLIPRVA